MRKVLIIEDRKRVLEILAFAVGRERYQIIRAGDGLLGLRLMVEHKPSIILLDLTQTEPNSFETCRGLREEGCEVPIILFVSSEEQADALIALELNADFILKPFTMEDLLMKIKVSTWEMDAQEGKINQLIIGRIAIDPEQLQVTKDGLPIVLTQREYDLLYYIAQEPGKVFSREELLGKVWEYSYMGDTRNVDVCIRRLREKLEDDASHPTVIVTRRGHGYVFIG